MQVYNPGSVDGVPQLTVLSHTVEQSKSVLSDISGSFLHPVRIKEMANAMKEINKIERRLNELPQRLRGRSVAYRGDVSFSITIICLT